LKGCDAFACKSQETTESDLEIKKYIKDFINKHTPIKVESDRSRFGGFFKKNKCKICKAGCQFVKDESRKALCVQGCDSFACKSAETESDKSRFGKKIGGFLKKNKCKICNAGCQFVKDESRKALCLQGCEQFACKSSATTESDKRKFGKKLKKAAKKVGGFLKKNKCKICNAGCQFVKDESKKALCLQGCEQFACKSAETSEETTESDLKLKKLIKKGIKKGIEAGKKAGKAYLKKKAAALLVGVESDESFKCKACKAGCQFISDETKKSLCQQACEAYACKK